MAVASRVLPSIVGALLALVVGCGDGGFGVPSPPEELHEAAASSAWAKEKIKQIVNRHDTTGLLFRRSDGKATELESERRSDLYRRTADFYVKQGILPRSSPQAAEHVELKAAYLMREYEAHYAVLVINHKGGPCDWASGGGCRTYVPKGLPPGAVLVVWSPGDQKDTFVGEVRK